MKLTTHLHRVSSGAVHPFSYTPSWNALDFAKLRRVQAADCPPQPRNSFSSRCRIALSLLASSHSAYYRVWILHVRRRCSCNSSRPHYLMGFTATGPSIQGKTHFMQLTLRQQRPARSQFLIADRVQCG